MIFSPLGMWLTDVSYVHSKILMIIHSESNKTNNADSGACKIQSCPGNKIFPFCTQLFKVGVSPDGSRFNTAPCGNRIPGRNDHRKDASHFKIHPL